MSTFTAIKKKNDELFNETLLFNPSADGWEFTGACCCEIKFKKDNIKLFAHSERKLLKVYKAGKKDKLIDVFRLPNNQLEFLIKTNGINVN